MSTRIPALALAAVTLIGCGGAQAASSAPAADAFKRDRPTHGSAARDRVSAAAVERALRSAKGERVTAVSCSRARGDRTFGRSRRSVFNCTVRGPATIAGTYSVEVLANGCFVAERHLRGRAIYGCGVRS